MLAPGKGGADRGRSDGVNGVGRDDANPRWLERRGGRIGPVELGLLLRFAAIRGGDQGHSLPSPGPPASLSLLPGRGRWNSAGVDGEIESSVGKEAGTSARPRFCTWRFETPRV